MNQVEEVSVTVTILTPSVSVQLDPSTKDRSAVTEVSLWPALQVWSWISYSTFHILSKPGASIM